MACIVNISGTGDATNGYATVNGTKYTSEASGIILALNTITFGVRKNMGVGGYVKVNGSEVHSATTGASTYTWTVPRDAVQVDIVLVREAYTANYYGYAVEVTTKTVDTSHRTLIDGTGYKVTGGNTMVGGTVYSITIGKAMVDGTVYEIAFAPSVITVDFVGNGNNSSCYATINGIKIYSAQTIECDAGTEISFYAWASSTTGKKNSKINLNGNTVVTGTSSAAATYNLVLDGTASTVNVTFAAGSNSSWVIYITTS